MSTFEDGTLYQVATNGKKLIRFTGAKSYVSALNNGGIVWAKVFGPGDTMPADDNAITDPTPAPGTYVQGWILLQDAQDSRSGAFESLGFNAGFTRLGSSGYKVAAVAIFCKQGPADVLIKSQ